MSCRHNSKVQNSAFQNSALQNSGLENSGFKIHSETLELKQVKKQ